MSASIGMIGGADGPTAIFVTGNPAVPVLVLAALVLLIFLAVRFFQKKK